jgi:hypothetical protein
VVSLTSWPPCLCQTGQLYPLDRELNDWVGSITGLLTRASREKVSCLGTKFSIVQPIAIYCNDWTTTSKIRLKWNSIVVHHSILYLQKLALTSPTSDRRLVGIVRSGTNATELLSLLLKDIVTGLHLQDRWRKEEGGEPLLLYRIICGCDISCPLQSGNTEFKLMLNTNETRDETKTFPLYLEHNIKNCFQIQPKKTKKELASRPTRRLMRNYFWIILFTLYWIRAN